MPQKENNLKFNSLHIHEDIFSFEVHHFCMVAFNVYVGQVIYYKSTWGKARWKVKERKIIEILDLY